MQNNVVLYLIEFQVIIHFAGTAHLLAGRMEVM
jgi:hypothetical protein